MIKKHLFKYTFQVTVCVALIAFASFSALAQDSATETTNVTPQEQQDLNFADGLYQREMFDTAAKQYADFINKYPDSPNARIALFRRAESLYQQGAAINEHDPVKGKVFMVEALNAFEKFINTYDEGEKLYESLLRFGEISYKLGDTSSAIEPLERVINNTKDQSILEAALFYSGRSHEREGNLETAEKRYRQLRDTFPQGEYSAYSTFLLGGILEESGKPSEAADLLNELWQNKEQYKFPEGSTLVEDAQLKAAQILYSNKDYAGASQAYRAYVALHPNGEHAPKAKYGAAWAEYQNENYGEALKIADTLQQQALSPELLAGILFLKGTCSYQQDLYQDAITYFRQVIANPDAGEYRDRSWYQLAWSYFLSDQFEDAIIECQNLLQQNLPLEMSANVHFLLGQSYARQDQLQNAIDEMNLVLELDPDSNYAPDALFLKADLHYRAKDYNPAGDEFYAYFTEYPNTPRAEEALLWACNSKFSAGQYQEAVTFASEFLEVFPDSQSTNEVLYRKALAHYQQEQFEQTLSTFDTLLATSQNPSRKPEALYWQGYIHERRDDLEKASQHYTRLLDEYPAFDKELDVTLRKALCDYRMENHTPAYEAFQTIIKTPKGKELHPEVIFWMIQHAREAGRHEEALATANRVIELFDNQEILERARVAKSNQLVELKRWDAAQSNAEDFLKQYPDSLFKPEIHWALGQALEHNEKPQEALKQYETALLGLSQMGNPDPGFEARLYVDRGEIFMEAEDYQNALDAYLRVAIIYDHPELTPKAIYKSIECYINLDNSTEAQNLYTELQERYAQSTWSKQAREQFAGQFSSEQVN